MCRYGVGARRLGAMTRLELLPGPLGLLSDFYDLFYCMFDLLSTGRVKWRFIGSHLTRAI